MKRLRTASIILFIASLLVFSVYMYDQKIAKDQTGPVFSIDNSTVNISVKDDEDALLQGITATDAGDGDVTNSIIVEAISPFTGTGHRIVSYAAFDSDNHVAHAKRELVYTDYVAPRFQLSKPLAFPMNATNILEGISVIDCIDGDISRNVRMMTEEEVDTAHVGEYSARLKVSNSAGGISYLPVTIEIYDASIRYRMPQIQLSENIVYLNKGVDFYEEDYLKSVLINGVEYTFVNNNGTYGSKYKAEDTDNTIDIDRVDIESDVDTDITGCYEVNYSFNDVEKGTGTGKARLYVVVTEEGEQ